MDVKYKSCCNTVNEFPHVVSANIVTRQNHGILKNIIIYFKPRYMYDYNNYDIFGQYTHNPKRFTNSLL